MEIKEWEPIFPPGGNHDGTFEEDFEYEGSGHSMNVMGENKQNTLTL